VTWTSRKHRDLERLLGEFRKELRRRKIGPAEHQYLLEVAEKHSELNFAADLMVTGDSGQLDDPPNIWGTIAMFLTIMRPEHGKNLEDHALIVPLMWWCGIAERDHGMERHTALCWFVQQCEDKEEKKIFRGVFGNATVDSIARRLYQKAKADGMFVLAGSRHEELKQAWFEGIEDNDLYELAWKALTRWTDGSGGATDTAYDIIRHEVPHNLPFSGPDPYALDRVGKSLQNN
jgi:hypothetical protein